MKNIVFYRVLLIWEQKNWGLIKISYPNHRKHFLAQASGGIAELLWNVEVIAFGNLEFWTGPTTIAPGCSIDVALTLEFRRFRSAKGNNENCVILRHESLTCSRKLPGNNTPCNWSVSDNRQNTFRHGWVMSPPTRPVSSMKLNLQPLCLLNQPWDAPLTRTSIPAWIRQVHPK